MRVGEPTPERLCGIINLMNPHEEYDRHNNCANELYKFLDDASNAPTTPEEVVVWGNKLKEIVKEFDITALLDILDNATNTLLKPSDIPESYGATKSKLVADIQIFMRDRKNDILGRADRLGLSLNEPSKPYIEAPFKIIFKLGNQENDIYINNELVELYPDDHVNNQWNPLLTKFILEKKLSKDDVTDATGANSDSAIQSTVSKLRLILRNNNLIRDDDIKVDISPFSYYSQAYKLKITERKKV